MSIKSLTSVNLKPRDDISKSRVEILVTHQAFIKIIILKIDAPFFSNTDVKGKAAYIGPAPKEPIIIDIIIPKMPESFPIYFIKYSLEIQTSIRPSKSIIGGSTLSISKKLDFAPRNVDDARSELIKYKTEEITIQIRNR